MSSNAKRCSNCSSSSMEHCLKIKCKYWAAGSHLDNETRRKDVNVKNNYPKCFVSNGHEYPLCKGGKFLKCNICNLYENFGEED